MLGFAAGEYTFLCGPIPFPYRIVALVIAECPSWTGIDPYYYFFVSDNEQVNVWPLPDENILSYGTLDSGSFGNPLLNPRTIPVDYIVNRSNTYLKLHCRKIAIVTRWISCIFIIEDLREVQI